MGYLLAEARAVGGVMIDANTQAILDAVSSYTAQHYAPMTAVADVGCGEGLLLHTLAGAGFSNLTGISYQPPDLAPIHTVSGVDVCAPDWSARCGGPYQLVISTEVIEHLTNPFLFLSEMRKLVAEGGELLLTFPNVHNIRSIIGYALTGRHSGFFGPNFNDGHPLHDQHIFIPNLHLIRYLLGIAGFSVQSERFLNGPGKLFSQTVMMIARHG